MAVAGDVVESGNELASSPGPVQVGVVLDGSAEEGPAHHHRRSPGCRGVVETIIQEDTRVGRAGVVSWLAAAAGRGGSGLAGPSPTDDHG